jgi:hypothetical protein
LIVKAAKKVYQHPEIGIDELPAKRLDAARPVKGNEECAA